MPQGQLKSGNQKSEGPRFFFSGNDALLFKLSFPEGLAVSIPTAISDAPTAFVPFALTPTSMTESGAQISVQPAALQTSTVLQASTASSCQPSGSTGVSQQAHAAAVSSSGHPQRGFAGAADVQSPPVATRGPGTCGRRRPSTAGRKRDREDPLTKAIERYMEAKAKREEGGEQSSPPSAPPQRAQRPRTAGTGGSTRPKSGSTSGTGNSSCSQPSGGGAPPLPTSTLLSQGFLDLNLASPTKAAAGGGTGGGGTAGVPTFTYTFRPCGAGEGDANVSTSEAAQQLGAQEGGGGTAGPEGAVRPQYSSLKEQLEAEMGVEMAATMTQAFGIWMGGRPQDGADMEPITQEQLKEARRQLAAAARPAPPGFKPAIHMPLLAEMVTQEQHAGGGRAGRQLKESGSTASKAGLAAPLSLLKGHKGAVQPYRVPLSGAAAGAQQAQQVGVGGGHSVGRTRYTFRTGRGKKRKDAGYVSFDSDDYADDNSDDELQLGEGEGTEGAARAAAFNHAQQAQQADSLPSSVTAPKSHSKQYGAPASDGTVRVTATGGYRGRGRPPKHLQQQQVSMQQLLGQDAAVHAAADDGTLRRSATLPLPRDAKGSETPPVGTLNTGGLTPLLSPTLASLFLDGQALPADQSHPIDLNADLENLLGDFDFSNDSVLIQSPQPAAVAVPPASAAVHAPPAFTHTAQVEEATKQTVASQPPAGVKPQIISLPLGQTVLPSAAFLGQTTTSGLPPPSWPLVSTALLSMGGVSGAFLNPTLPLTQTQLASLTAAMPPALLRTITAPILHLPPAAAAIKTESPPLGGPDGTLGEAVPSVPPPPPPALPNTTALGATPGPAVPAVDGGGSPPAVAAGTAPPGPGLYAGPPSDGMHGDGSGTPQLPTGFDPGAPPCDPATTATAAALAALEGGHPLQGGVTAEGESAAKARLDPAQDPLEIPFGFQGQTPLGSPLLQGLMSPTALGQLLDSW